MDLPEFDFSETQAAEVANEYDDDVIAGVTEILTGIKWNSNQGKFSFRAQNERMVKCVDHDINLNSS